MEFKKKRGCNYTASEKEFLFELIKRHQDIIDSKETNAHMIAKKKEAWESVCQQYNTVAVSGVRTWQQLRHLYDNMKHRFKKINEGDNTSAGTYKSSLSDLDSQINHVQPLAKYYYDDDSNVGDIQQSTSEGEYEASVANDDNIDDLEITTAMDHECIKSEPRTSKSGKTGHANSKRKHNSIVEEYFKKKLVNVKLENKYLRNKNKMEINKYKMEMEILKLKLKILKAPRKF